MSALLGLVPGWLVVILLALAWTAIGTGLVLLVRRLVGHDRLAPHNDVAGFVFAGVGVVYAVLLAFVVIGVWDRYEVDQQAAQVEAAHLLTIHRLAGFVDGGEVVQPAIRHYAELVVSDDWPAMANGGLAETTDVQLRRVSQEAVAIPAFDEGGWAGLFIDDLHALRIARVEREAAASSSLPGVLWLAILLGGLITVGYVAVYGVRDRALHVVFTAAFAALVGLSMGVIVVLDHPYTGDTAVSPAPFVRAMALMDKVDPAP